MPVITVDWWQGNDRARRARMVREVTGVVSRIANCPEAAVTVIVRDVERSHWALGGVLADEPPQPATGEPGPIAADLGGQP